LRRASNDWRLAVAERNGAEWGTPAAPARHALLRVEPSAYASTLAEREDLAGEPLLVDWAEQGRPLIARRREPCDQPGRVAAGIPLPPSHGKKRIALQVSTSAIRSVLPPPLLADAARAAPTAWRPAIDAIEDLCLRVGVDVRAFGALAWSSLTGLHYLSATSDLDLLFDLKEDTDVALLLDGLARIEAIAPMRLDGEVVRCESGAANWRELRSGAEEIVVKTIDGVALWPRPEFLLPRIVAPQDGRGAS
jgi:phosphoribosyl-dephospho-CoA transferase